MCSGVMAISPARGSESFTWEVQRWLSLGNSMGFLGFSMRFSRVFYAGWCFSFILVFILLFDMFGGKSTFLSSVPLCYREQLSLAQQKVSFCSI